MLSVVVCACVCVCLLSGRGWIGGECLTLQDFYSLVLCGDRAAGEKDVHDYAESKPAAVPRCLPLLTVFAFKLGGIVLVYASLGLFPAHVFVLYFCTLM